MPKQELEAMGKMARQWVIDGFSVEVVGKIFEDFIDMFNLGYVTSKD